jgi:hypothetical protein
MEMEDAEAEDTEDSEEVEGSVEMGGNMYATRRERGDYIDDLD